MWCVYRFRGGVCVRVCVVCLYRFRMCVCVCRFRVCACVCGVSVQIQGVCVCGVCLCENWSVSPEHTRVGVCVCVLSVCLCENWSVSPEHTRVWKT